jgi:hypothetical protein
LKTADKSSSGAYSQDGEPSNTEARYDYQAWRSN